MSRGISVAFLSKLPFDEEQDITLFPKRSPRSASTT